MTKQKKIAGGMVAKKNTKKQKLTRLINFNTMHYSKDCYDIIALNHMLNCQKQISRAKHSSIDKTGGYIVASVAMLFIEFPFV